MTVEILEATPTLNGNIVQWKLCNVTTNKCSSTPPYSEAEAVLGYDTDLHPFVVQIVDDKTGLGIKFASDPLWIQANNKPTVHVIEPTDQIQQVSPGGHKVLSFVDHNKGDAMVLKYQLNFADQNNNKVTAIDPDIKNGGGSTFYNLSVMEVLIGGAILLAAGFFLRPLYRAIFGRGR